ncbi:uncharacterized protein LOC133036739 [Cannabis sativa]|uniref:uncharacterized protein LOC133036739 n=1 Tax=Cannabis sativa TaxID=3483 RepID=UPI0029CA6641|nr:uncharacterized protein LOC133036739 [Cannabis sativa]
MEFEFHMRELDNLDKRIRPYLEKIGHEKWSRYSTMTSNIAEALNSANLAKKGNTGDNINGVKPANQNLFDVIDEDRTRIVNLKEKTCTCNRFQKDEMPCNHAVAVMKDLNINTYNYCAQYYTSKAWLQTYEETVYPVGNVREWELPDFFEEIIVLPPKERIKSGRPRKRRMAAAWETKKQNKCGKCGQKGHNKKTCRRITA